MPSEIYPFALLGKTGPTHLERALRYAASLKGLRLNDTGLYYRNDTTRRLEETFQTERDIFEFLGFAYLEPFERSDPEKLVKLQHLS